jgi:hypothetical protein
MEKVAYEFEKGNNELVRATISDFAGKRRADLRVYFQTEDGAWHPTKRGLSLTADMVGQLKEAVVKLEKAVGPH